MSASRVLISGAGIGGLALATALGRRGVAADVVEAKSDNAVQGIGISIPANAVRVLKRLDILEPFLAQGLVFDSYRLFDADGELVVSVPMPKVRPDGLPSYLGIPRPAYAEILLEAARSAGATVSFSTKIASIVERDDAVVVTFTTGVTRDYDVVIGADGVRSSLRREFFGADYEPVFSGSACWRAPVRRPPDVTFMATFQGLGSRAGLVPISEDAMYLFLVDGHAQSQPENVRFDTSRYYDTLVSRLDEYGGIVAKLRGELTPSDIVWSPFERVQLPLPWHRGRIALMGDAAHAMSANISQGASSALEDALVLAEELTGQDSLEAALTAYGTRRYPRARMVQDISHRMLLNETSTDPDVLATRAAEIAASPDKFRELAIALEAPL